MNISFWVGGFSFGGKRPRCPPSVTPLMRAHACACVSVCYRFDSVVSLSAFNAKVTAIESPVLPLDCEMVCRSHPHTIIADRFSLPVYPGFRQNQRKSEKLLENQGKSWTKCKESGKTQGWFESSSQRFFLSSCSVNVVLSVKSSSLKYEQAKQIQHDKEKLEKQNDQLQILTCKMKETNSKIEQLIKLMTSLIMNSRLVFEAEKSPQNASLLLPKATAMKSTCKENKDVKKLEGVLKLLVQKSRVQLKLHAHGFMHVLLFQLL